MRYGTIKQDDAGFYVMWGNSFDTRRETLRTKSKERAEAWRVAGNCHGANAHDRTCPCCESQVHVILLLDALKMADGAIEFVRDRVTNENGLPAIHKHIKRVIEEVESESICNENIHN